MPTTPPGTNPSADPTSVLRVRVRGWLDEQADEVGVDVSELGQLIHEHLYGVRFQKLGMENPTDPRDRFPDVADDLCAIVMDTLLANPTERPSVSEIRESLASFPERKGTSPIQGDALMARGGVVVDVPRASLAQAFGSRLMDFDEVRERLEGWVEHQHGIPLGDRAELLTQMAMEAVEPAAVGRTCSDLAYVLERHGVRVLWFDGPNPDMWAWIDGLTSLPRGPLIGLGGQLEPSRVRRLQWCGVLGVPALAPPRVPSRQDALLARAVCTERLELYEAPHLGGWVSVLGERVEAWLTPSTFTGSQASVRSSLEVYRSAFPLLWLDAKLARHVGRWLERQSMRDGDVGALIASQVLLAGFMEARVVTGGSREARSREILVRALSLHRREDFGALRDELEGRLPLAGLEPREGHLLEWLLGEARIGVGEWRAARRTLWRLRGTCADEDDPYTAAACVASLGRLGPVDVLGDAPLDGLWARALGRARQDLALRMGERKEARRWARTSGSGAWTQRLSGRVPRSDHVGSDAFVAIEEAVSCRDSAPEFIAALERAEQRFEALRWTFHALICRRYRGLVVGGVVGGNLIDQVDRRVRQLGCRNVARLGTVLLPELCS